MPEFKSGQNVWYLKPGMPVPLEMVYCGVVFDKPGIHGLMTRGDTPVVLETKLRCVYTSREEAQSIAELWVRDRIETIAVEIRRLEVEQENLRGGL